MVSTVSEQSASNGKNERSRNVLLLPSHLFFVRSLSLPVGLSPEELSSFVELSLEEISPFAINQLYYGYYLPAGSERVLVFAAYRKQLAVYEEDPAWVPADLVLPDFTAALGLSRKGPTLAFVQDEHELTAIYWSGDEQVPERVLSRHLEPVDGKLPVENVREELRRRMGSLPKNLTTVSLSAPEARVRDRNLVCSLTQVGKSEKISTEISRADSLSMDIRDKGFLLATRKTQRQNRLLWAGVLAACFGFLALVILEGALFAGRYMLDTREANILALEPEVLRIQEEEQLANRLEELSGERLLPFEMLAFLNRYRPPSIYYTSARLPARARDGEDERRQASRLRSFEIEARTPRPQDVDRFQRLLENEKLLERVEIRNQLLRGQDGLSSFTVAGTFHRDALNGFAPTAPTRAEETASEEELPATAPEAEAEAAPEEEPEVVAIPELPPGELPEGDIELPVSPPASESGAMPLPQIERDEERSDEEGVPMLPPPPPPEEDDQSSADLTTTQEEER